jgi:phosphopantothenoylcysteine decarboxylase / phosphopantothenate---cysteine ligase
VLNFSNLESKKIIIGVSGSIAAYKIAVLVRLLVKNGAEVQILMTESATRFITPLTLATLSKRAVFTEIVSEESWNNHVELGLWADAFVVAPATATTLSKLANGHADNIVTATYLSARCPVFVAPAMDLDMWHHASTQKNIAALQSYGNHIIPVEHGELASGLVGDGRMAEPENITAFLDSFFKQKQDLKGKKILLTAGPTFEALDPVRFIGNRSSGKMGIALAENLAARGAAVKIILGPTKNKPNNPGIDVLHVESAQEMYDQAHRHFAWADAAILAAAVADYRPKLVSSVKIKKNDASFSLELEKTPDIALSLGKIKGKNQVLVGFALETNNALENALSKLKRKNFDFIVLNTLEDSGAGFSHDTNKIALIFGENDVRHFQLKAKTTVAADIVDALVARFSEQHLAPVGDL